jgi:glycosyltransferase involved in cell wall biosynthesis
VKTYPPIEEIKYRAKVVRSRKTLSYYFGKLKKLRIKTIIYYLKRINGCLRELILVLEGYKRSLNDFNAMKALLDSYKPDVIIYRLEEFNFAPFRVGTIYNIPVLTEVNSFRSMQAHLINRRNKATFVTRWAERKAIRSSDRLFSVSRPIKQYIDKHDRSSKSCVIPNGVDIDKFDPSRFKKVAIKDELGLNGRTILGYVGSYKTWHGLESVIKIIDLLRRRDPKYHLLMIGMGIRFFAIQKQIIENDLSNFVTQIDFVPHEDIPRYMASFDYALMFYPEISSFYFSPLKMFEYMAMALPVVTTAVGQMKEIVRQGETGVLVYPPTPENYVKAIFDADQDPERLRRIGTSARRLMVEKYSWLKNAEKIIEVCNGLVAERKKGGSSGQ